VRCDDASRPTAPSSAVSTWNNEAPKPNLESFIASVRELPMAESENFVLQAALRRRDDPESVIFSSLRLSPNTVKHFERAKNLMKHYVVMGDALACTNPSYAQGASVVAAEAEILDACLASSLDVTTPSVARLDDVCVYTAGGV
jgi:2-polyprenyl-6-methoxyphenol hydroxylase-like FAD-dependent oxidoreductase